MARIRRIFGGLTGRFTRAKIFPAKTLVNKMSAMTGGSLEQYCVVRLLLKRVRGTLENFPE